MARCHDGMTLMVDLTEVTFVDSVGEEYYHCLVDSGRNLLPKRPTHWIYVNVFIFALFRSEGAVGTYRALPAQTLATQVQLNATKR